MSFWGKAIHLAVMEEDKKKVILYTLGLCCFAGIIPDILGAFDLNNIIHWESEIHNALRNNKNLFVLGVGFSALLFKGK